MPITWTNTIKGQFEGFDIEHMKQITGNALKLDDYASVKTWAGQIWTQVSQDFMPPGAPWSAAYKQNFKTWMDSGMPEGAAAPGGTATTPGSTATTVTWTNTIKGQFTQLDVDHMRQVSGGSIDLSSYTSTKANGPSIYGMVSRKRMPPGNPWSTQSIQNFKAWMDSGYPEN